jgi:hypothetical protein
MRYQKQMVSKGQQLEYYVASRISSVVECFAAICGDRHHQLSRSVGLLTLYIENQKVFLLHPEINAEETLNQSSSNRERYFYRSQGEENENVTYHQYFSLFESTKGNDGAQDGCPQPHNILRRRKVALYKINDISLKGDERFCLRVLLLNVPTRKWVQLKTVSHRTYDIFAEAAREHGLVLDRKYEA